MQIKQIALRFFVALLPGFIVGWNVAIVADDVGVNKLDPAHHAEMDAIGARVGDGDVGGHLQNQAAVKLHLGAQQLDQPRSGEGDQLSLQLLFGQVNLCALSLGADLGIIAAGQTIFIGVEMDQIIRRLAYLDINLPPLVAVDQPQTGHACREVQLAVRIFRRGRRIVIDIQCVLRGHRQTDR